MDANSDYLRRRATEERAAAEQATNERVRELHLELAARYLEAAEGGVLPHAAATNDHARVAPDEFRIIR